MSERTPKDFEGLRRWTDAPPGAALQDQRMQALFSVLPSPPRLTGAAVERVWRRLDAPRRRMHRRTRLLLAFAIVALPGAAIAGASVFKASLGLSTSTDEVEAPAPTPAPLPSSGAPAGPPEASAPADLGPPEASTPADLGLPGASAPADPGPAKAEPEAPPPASAGPTMGSFRSAPGTLARESELVGAAVGALRKHKAPARALAIIERYDREFPNGILRKEAAVIRADALSALDRDKAAKAEEEAPATLKAASAACAGATAAPTGQATKDERALFGRGQCRARAKDVAGARSDLQAYLARHPAGAYAAQARALLTSLH